MVTTIVEDNVEEDFWSMATMTTVMMTTMVIMKLMAMITVNSMIVIRGTERGVISVSLLWSEWSQNHVYAFSYKQQVSRQQYGTLMSTYAKYFIISIIMCSQCKLISSWTKMRPPLRRDHIAGSAQYCRISKNLKN